MKRTVQMVIGLVAITVFSGLAPGSAVADGGVSDDSSCPIPNLPCPSIPDPNLEDAGTLHDQAYEQVAWAGNLVWGLGGDNATDSYVNLLLGGGPACDVYAASPDRSGLLVYGYGWADCPGNQSSVKVCVQIKIAGDWKKQGCAEGLSDGTTAYAECEPGTWWYRTKVLAFWCNCQVNSPGRPYSERQVSSNARVTC